jgi:hypothetical protein
MSKLLGTVSALGLVTLLALPGAASASEQAGATSMKTSNTIEVSSQRRFYRGGYGWRPHYRRYGYYGPYRYAPYRAYAYSPYYRPYYRPGFAVGVGPFGFGFGY